MNKATRAISIAAAVGMTATMLAACGGKDDNKQGASASTSPQASAAASASPSATPKSDPVTISFVIPNTTDNTPFVKIFQEFEKKTGNKVELQPLPGGDYDNLLKTRFSTGDFPDLFLMQPGTKQYVKLRADETLYDWANEKDTLDRLLPSFKDFQVLNGKIYGIPIGSSGAYGVFYNKDVFAKAGVQPPKNYADLIEIAKKIKASGVTPFYEGVKDGWPAQIFYLTGWVTQVDPAIGADGVKKLEANQLKLADIPAVRDLFVKQGELKKLGLFQDNLLAGTYDEMQNLFGQNKVAMSFMLDGVIPQLSKKFGEEFVKTKVGFFPFPSDKDAGTAMITPPNQLMVPKSGKHSKQAIELVKFMTSKEMANLYYQTQPGIPIFKDATSTLYPTQQTVKDLMDAGKGTINVQNRLTASFADFQKTLQTFFIDGDVDKALKEFDANYQKDGKNKLLPGF